jgi:hypothetical protein
MAQRGFATLWTRGAIDKRRSKHAHGQKHVRRPIVVVFEDGSEHTSMRSTDDKNDDDDDNESGDDDEALRTTRASTLHGVRHDLVDIYDVLPTIGFDDRLVWLCRVSWARPVRPPPTVVEQTASMMVVRNAPASKKRRREEDDGDGDCDSGSDCEDGTSESEAGSGGSDAEVPPGAAAGGWRVTGL